MSATAAAILVSGVLIAGALLAWPRTRRTVTTPAERAVHTVLHTAAEAAR
ncbi:sensor histidine kinase, partial [Nocardia seriolae]|nr:sensor histidine kinase [Nocardia seriolae]